MDYCSCSCSWSRSSHDLVFPVYWQLCVTFIAITPTLGKKLYSIKFIPLCKCEVTMCVLYLNHWNSLFYVLFCERIINIPYYAIDWSTIDSFSRYTSVANGSHTSLQHPFYWRVIFWIYLGILAFAADRTCIHLLFYLHLQSFLTIFHLSIHSSIKTFIH